MPFSHKYLLFLLTNFIATKLSFWVPADTVEMRAKALRRRIDATVLANATSSDAQPSL